MEPKCRPHHLVVALISANASWPYKRSNPLGYFSFNLFSIAVDRYKLFAVKILSGVKLDRAVLSILELVFGFIL